MTFLPDDPFQVPHGAVEFAYEMMKQICWLPHPHTVAAFGNAPVFLNMGSLDTRYVKQAFTWSQDKVSIGEGWSLAKVFDDTVLAAHLGNLVLIQSWAVGLAQSNGPMSAFLQHHAQQTYKLNCDLDPIEWPKGYEPISWNYLPITLDPKANILKRIEGRHSKGRPPKKPNLRLLDMIAHWNDV